ncbi:hypothetical protein [Nocardioides speluncae]|uniref:hypothetical protein n=1 Tax=Nocardioides speluncae TaxID=2670337 RepID=UPI0012B16606|nr:hypothetical protein [Nocardioides speluncae]
MSLLGQGELLERIGKAMASSATDDWRMITLEFSAVRSMSQSELRIESNDGRIDGSQLVADEGDEACEDLRAAMYQPGKGTWYNATFTITKDGNLVSEFDYDNPPLEGEAEDILLTDDQEGFPRNPENLPDWHPSRPTD